jgi:hypothetical protein
MTSIFKMVLGVVLTGLVMITLAAPVAPLDCSKVDPAKTLNPVGDAGFPLAFEQDAVCQCIAHGMDKNFCEGSTKQPPYNVPTIFALMVATYGSLKGGCDSQHLADPAVCVKEWRCFCTGQDDKDPGSSCAKQTYCPVSSVQ